jgi:hsp70-interacting protein
MVPNKSFTITQTDLHSIGGLDPLLGYLKNSHAGIRAKAAEVVSTIVQNNPKSQQLVMESNGLEPLLTNFKSDPSTSARTKALGAISCKWLCTVVVQTFDRLCSKLHTIHANIHLCFAALIRHNQPGISAFRLGNGYAGLKDALGSDDARLQRYVGGTRRAVIPSFHRTCNLVALNSVLGTVELQ